MKKVFAGLVILLSAVLCLSGCEDNKIDDGLEKQVTEKGKEMMQAWVDENMPGAELDEAATAFLFETLGITPEIKDFSCFVMAPAQDGESTTKTFNKYFNFGIPADVKNIDAFVREPGSRPQLEVTADLRLPEDTDLFAYNLAGVKSLCEECGIFFHNLDLATEDQEFSSLWSRETTTYERGWIDQDDFRLRGVLRYRAEEEDSRTQEVKVSDRTFDPEKDLILEKTETGFRYAFPDKDWDHGFRIQVDKESGFGQHDYLYLDDEDEKDSEKRWKEYAAVMTWKDFDDGTSLMVQAGQGAVQHFYGSGEFRRAE
jgi:hypothetical protein